MILYSSILESVNALVPSAHPSSRPSHQNYPRRSRTRSPILPILIVAPFLLATTTPAFAAPPQELKFTGSYEDLFHPSCVREINVAPSISIDAKGKKAKKYIATFKGTDVGPVGIGDKVIMACDAVTIEKYGLRNFEFEGKVDGHVVDAGDGVHEGVYKSIRNGDTFEGIKWKDGNRWIKKTEVEEGKS